MKIDAKREDLGEIRRKIVNKLMELGLSPNESKAYEALIELEVATPLEIASFTGIPVSRIYYVLTELEKKGLVETQDGRPRLYRALNPKKGLELLTEKYYVAKSEVLKYIDMLVIKKDTIKNKGFWTIKGRKNIRTRIKSLIEESTLSLAIASIDKLIKNLYKEILGAAHRDVNISMVIYSTSSILTKRLIEKFKHYAVIKIRSIVAPSVFLVDDRKGLAYIPEYLYKYKKGKSETALLIENDEFLPILGTYFRYFLWYPSKLVNKIERFLTKPRTYCIYYRAVEDAKYMLEKGIRLKARAVGRFSGSNENVILEGEIVDAYISPDRVVYNITLKTDMGTRYILGGKRCVLEDFETEVITLIPFI